MTGKLQRLIADVTFDEVTGRIVSLAVKTRHRERALDARLATIESHLGIPTPPKFAKGEQFAKGEDTAPAANGAADGGRK